MQFCDKTAYVWGLRYWWDPSLSRNPFSRFPHFMPPWLVERDIPKQRNKKPIKASRVPLDRQGSQLCKSWMNNRTRRKTLLFFLVVVALPCSLCNLMHRFWFVVFHATNPCVLCRRGVGVYFVLQGWGKGCRTGRGGGWTGFWGVGGTRSGGGVQIVETKRLPGSKAQCSPCVTCLVYNLSHQSQLGAALPAATRLNAVNNKSPWSDQQIQVRVKTKRQDKPKQNI